MNNVCEALASRRVSSLSTCAYQQTIDRPMAVLFMPTRDDLLSIRVMMVIIELPSMKHVVELWLSSLHGYIPPLFHDLVSEQSASRAVGARFENNGMVAH